MRRLARRMFPRRAMASRVLFLGVTWVMAAAFGACLLSIAWAYVRGDGREWRRVAGSRTYVWGVGGDAYVGWYERLPDSAARRGERRVADQWDFTREVSFGVGRRFDMDHNAYYSRRPGDTYDPPTDKPQKLASFRRVVGARRGVVMLDLGRCAAVLGLPLAILLLRHARRYVVRRRRLSLTHCRSCGYDLRATPDRCPECGTTAGFNSTA